VLEHLLTYLSQPVATLLAGILAAVTTVLLGFVVGRRKTVHDRLYEEQAKVVAALFERFETLDKRIYDLVHPYDVGKTTKLQKATEAARSFNDLQFYYRSKSIWFSRGTSRRVEHFIGRYRQTFQDFSQELGRENPHPDAQKWLEVWTRFEKESPEIRDRLETEFRAALGYRTARLRRVGLNTRPLLSRSWSWIKERRQ